MNVILVYTYDANDCLNPRTADVTTWAYDEASGLVTSKTDADSNVVSYDYTPDGKLAERTWARSSSGSHVTTYDYFDDSGEAKTGQLQSVTYSGSVTPAIGFTYNRLGQAKTVTDAVGTRTFAYNAALRLDTESIDGSSGGLYTKLITRKYEDGTGWTIAGRDAGFQIGTSGGDPDEDYEITYIYDGTYGRLANVKGPALPVWGASYSRVTDSELIGQLDFYSSSGPVATVTRVYEAERDLLDYIENKINTDPVTTVSKYDYGLDLLGRRTSVVHTGEAFEADHHFGFDYNDRNELKEADRYEDTSGTTHTSSPFAWDFDYDNIGNRETFKLDDDGTGTVYTADNLNRYTDIDPQGDPAKEYLCYDADGNLVQDAKSTSNCETDNGTFDYTWDVENRLISIVPVSPATDDKKVEFEYDYMSRRVRKTVSTYNGSAWDEDADWLFVYDGWNVVLVLDANDSNATIRKYTWGLDMSGTLQGAGGIGGLLACADDTGESTKHYWFVYDGNGNVVQVLDATDVDPITDMRIVAHYEYDPYGHTIVINNDVREPDGDVETANAGYANANPFRFSTKWLDTELAASAQTGAIGETGLYYYGYRYYSPSLGRWLNRDPIEERGGLNLYVFVENEPQNKIDALGRWPWPNPFPPYTPITCGPWAVSWTTGWQFVFLFPKTTPAGTMALTGFVATSVCKRTCWCGRLPFPQFATFGDSSIFLQPWMGIGPYMGPILAPTCAFQVSHPFPPYPPF